MNKFNKYIQAVIHLLCACICVFFFVQTSSPLFIVLGIINVGGVFFKLWLTDRKA